MNQIQDRVAPIFKLLITRRGVNAESYTVVVIGGFNADLFDNAFFHSAALIRR